jgi:hypothetical protein
MEINRTDKIEATRIRLYTIMTSDSKEKKRKHEFVVRDYALIVIRFGVKGGPHCVD